MFKLLITDMANMKRPRLHSKRDIFSLPFFAFADEFKMHTRSLALLWHVQSFMKAFCYRRVFSIEHALPWISGRFYVDIKE